MPFEPIIPDGHHLGTSRSIDGAVTGHIFEDGSNTLKGHAAWQWVDEPEQSYSTSYEYQVPRELTAEERELIEKLAGMILAGIMIGVAAATPHVKRWWSEKALPAMKTTWSRVTKRKVIGGGLEPSPPQASSVVSEAGVEIILAEPKIKMSHAEWAQRFRAMLAAGNFRDEQQRILANAQVEDDDLALALEAGRARELTPAQFAERVKRMLAANPELLNDETATELMRVFSTRRQASNELGQ